MPYVKSKPRVRSAQNDFEVLPLGEMGSEVPAGGPRSLHTLHDSIGVNVRVSFRKEVLNIVGGLLDVTFDIHSEARRLGNGQSEIQGDNAGDASQTDEEAPQVVDMIEIGVGIFRYPILVGSHDYVRHKAGS
jgi:hypothetical protein